MKASLGALLLGGVTCLACCAVVLAQEKSMTPKFKVTLRRADDASTISGDKERVVFALKSPFGISRAVIERLEEQWPRAVVVRLHLKGLSDFRAENGKTTLHAAASIENGKVRARVWKDGQETPGLDEKSPYWLDIRAVGKDGKPGQEVPLKDGYFEVVLPRAFFEGNPKSVSVQWIDFYRQ